MAITILIEEEDLKYNCCKSLCFQYFMACTVKGILVWVYEKSESSNPYLIPGITLCMYQLCSERKQLVQVHNALGPQCPLQALPEIT